MSVWHTSHWWTWPAAIVLGLAVNYVIWCVIPPRYPPPWRWKRASGAGSSKGEQR